MPLFRGLFDDRVKILGLRKGCGTLPSLKKNHMKAGICIASEQWRLPTWLSTSPLSNFWYRSMLL